MRHISVAELHGLLKAQRMPAREHFAFLCPMCGTVQSAQDLINAGAGRTFDDVERYLGFSCVGRFTGASTPRDVPDGEPCDWTLGGLFQTHRIEVVGDAGKADPLFEPATPEQAQQHLDGDAGPAS